MSGNSGQGSGHDGMGGGVEGGGIAIVVLVVDGKGIGCMMQRSMALDRQTTITYSLAQRRSSA